jgi:hypothetical protein
MMFECQIIPFPGRRIPEVAPDKGDSERVRLIKETAALVRQNGGRLNWGDQSSFSAPGKPSRQTPRLFLVPLFPPNDDAE